MTTQKQKTEVEKILNKYYDNITQHITQSYGEIVDKLNKLEVKNRLEMQRFANEIMKLKLGKDDE